MTRQVSISELRKVIYTSDLTGFKWDGKHGAYHLFSKNDMYKMLIGEGICILEKDGEEIELDHKNENKIKNVWKDVTVFGGKWTKIEL